MDDKASVAAETACLSPLHPGAPAPAPALRENCCAIATDTATELALLRSLLQGKFTELIDVTTGTDWTAFVHRNDVAVLLLAFSDFAAATDFHRRYAEARATRAGIPAMVVMLCSRENVNAAYDMCRAQTLFDYVPFWPVTHDPKRLPLAMHRACDAWMHGAPDIAVPQATPSSCSR